MARGDKTKELAFQLWCKQRPLSEIQKEVARRSTTLAASVRGWVLDWERGKHGVWTPDITNSN